MMQECIQKKMVLNNKVVDCGLFSNNYLKKGTSIYELIRIIDGKPLFLEDHFERLANSLSLLHYKPIVCLGDLKKHMRQLIEANSGNFGNCKFLVNFHEMETNVLCYFIEHRYPGKEEYEKGVSAILYEAERKNPTAKTVLFKLRNEIDRIKVKEKLYEVLLVNRNNHITEGSRSNVFFIKDNQLFTYEKNGVLPGITRKYVQEICVQHRIDFIETPVNANELKLYDSAFISGTSPKILPLRKVNNFHFSVKHAILDKITREYDKRVRAYLAGFSWEGY